MAELAARRARVSLPIAIKFARQPIRHRRVFDPQHHVMPGEIVIGKVDPANPRYIINNQQFLMVTRGIGERIVAHRIGDPQAHTSRFQPIEHVPCRLRLGVERPVAGERKEAVIDDMAGVIIDQQTAFLRSARRNCNGHRLPGSIAFKSHRLNQNAVLRGGHIVLNTS